VCCVYVRLQPGNGNSDCLQVFEIFLGKKIEVGDGARKFVSLHSGLCSRGRVSSLRATPAGTRLGEQACLIEQSQPPKRWATRATFLGTGGRPGEW